MPSFNKLMRFYWLQLTLVLLLGGYLLAFGHWQLETNLLSLLPKNAQNQTMLAAEQALFADKQKQVVVLVSGDEAVAAYHMLSQGVNSLAEVSMITSPQPTIAEIAEFYLPYRDNFLSAQYRTALDGQQALAQLVAGQLTQLTNPFVSATLAEAPRLNLADYLQNAMMQMGDIEYHHGIPAINVEQQTYLIAQLQLTIDGFSLNASKHIASELEQLFGEITSAHHVELYYSGIIFHTAASTTQAKHEISTFGTLSIVAVVLLLMFVFRSVAPLVCALLTLILATFYGLSAILLFFDKLHILTLVFAVTLIGIVIDYCFHFFVYATSNQQQKKSITQPLLLGFITTALGYLALIFSPLSLLSQVAVFMIFGLLGALLTVLILLPNVKQLAAITTTNSAQRYTFIASRFFQRLLPQKSAVLSAVFVSLLGVYYLQAISFNDDVKLLNSSPPWLLAHEQKVGQIFNYQHLTRIIVQAKSAQQLLEQQEQAIEQLLSVQPLLSIKSLSHLLPSIKRQKADFERIKYANEQGKFQQALAITGLVDPITSFVPLTLQRFSQGPLAPMSELFLTSYKGEASLEQQQYAAWFEVYGDLSQVNIDWINTRANVAIFDKAHDTTMALGVYRQGITWLLIIAFATVAAVLIIKFGLTAGALATFCTISSGLIALMVSQLLSGHLNIFNLLAALLILALAIDYVIFYQEHGVVSATVLAISLSALSSALVFGILVFSQTPAVNSFGLTVMIGIIAIFILAPLSSIKNNN